MWPPLRDDQIYNGIDENAVPVLNPIKVTAHLLTPFPTRNITVVGGW